MIPVCASQGGGLSSKEISNLYSVFAGSFRDSYNVKCRLVIFISYCINTFSLVSEIPRSFERASPSNFRTKGSFIHINSGKIFERDLLSSDGVAKSATRKPLVF